MHAKRETAPKREGEHSQVHQLPPARTQTGTHTSATRAGHVTPHSAPPQQPKRGKQCQAKKSRSTVPETVHGNKKTKEHEVRATALPFSLPLPLPLPPPSPSRQHVP